MREFARAVEVSFRMLVGAVDSEQKGQEAPG